MLLGQIIILITLLVVIVQDFKERAISLWTIPLIFGTSLYLATQHIDWEWWHLKYNLAFLAIQIIGLTLYFSIKQKQLTNITQAYLGSGDLLFFIAISPLFAPLHFVIFFIGSLLIITIGFLIYQQFTTKKTQSIPLAGAMSICLIIYQLFLFSFAYSSYNDWFLLQLIYG